jgi:hypothetical protein
VELNYANSPKINKDFISLNLDEPFKLIVEAFFDRLDFVGFNNDRGGIRMYEFLETYLEGEYLIPYAIDKRRKKFPKAFKELAPYIAKYV